MLTACYGEKVGKIVELPSELTLPHHGRLEHLEPAGEGAAAWILRSGAVGVKVARATGELAVRATRREAIVRAVLGVGGPIDGGLVRIGRARHPALAFRWVAGTRLSSVVGREHGAAWLEAVARDVGEALARLHLLGYRHGDVKPDNVIVRRGKSGPRAALVDLGLAAPFGEPLVGGSLEWLAPEALVDPEHVGAAADVFALGRTLRRTAERLGVEPPVVARDAEAAHPGDRPSAARLAGWPDRRVPIDAAYLRVRLMELEQASSEGLAPPLGRAGPWCEGLMRALAGLAGTKLGERPLTPLDAAGRRSLLARAIGADASEWSLPTRFEDEEALLAALCAVRETGDSSRGSLIGGLERGTERVSLALALAEVSLRPDDDDALARLADASLGAPLDDPTVHAATTLLRRAGRLAAARAIAVPRAALSSDWRLEAAELARLDGDRPGAELQLLDAAPCARSLALRARLALDVGDLVEARSLLAGVSPVDAAGAEGLALLAHAEGRWDDGLRALDAARVQDPERRARGLMLRGMLLHGRGDPGAASRAFHRGADLALALAAVPLEATARASAAAAAHDAGKLGDALESSARAIDLLERLGRRGDAARARLNRAAALVAVGARADAIAEARRAGAEALAAGDARAADYARWIEVDAATLEPQMPIEPAARGALAAAIGRS